MIKIIHRTLDGLYITNNQNMYDLIIQQDYINCGDIETLHKNIFNYLWEVVAKDTNNTSKENRNE